MIQHSTRKKLIRGSPACFKRGYTAWRGWNHLLTCTMIILIIPVLSVPLPGLHSFLQYLLPQGESPFGRFGEIFETLNVLKAWVISIYPEGL